MADTAGNRGFSPALSAKLNSKDMADTAGNSGFSLLCL